MFCLCITWTEVWIMSLWKSKYCFVPSNIRCQKNDKILQKIMQEKYTKMKPFKLKILRVPCQNFTITFSFFWWFKSLTTTFSKVQCGVDCFNTQGTFLASKSAYIRATGDFPGIIGHWPKIIQIMEKANKKIFIFILPIYIGFKS